MGLLPDEAVRAYVESELPAARAWASRRRLELAVDEASLTLNIRLAGPAASATGHESYLLSGTFHDYRALPPAWRFLDPRTGADVGPPAYPAPLVPNPRGSNLFIGGGPTGAVICAHFNRLAYVAEQGPHGDWGPPANWLSLPPSQYTRADTIGDMLARIDLEVRESAGRMAPLV